MGSLLAIAAIALLSACWNALFVFPTPLTFPDSYEYLEVARSIAAGNATLADLPVEVAPGYPWMIAQLADFRPARVDYATLLRFQLAAAVVADLALFRMVHLLFGSRLARTLPIFVATVALAVEHSFMNGYLMTESLYVDGLVISTALLIEAMQSGRAAWLIAAVASFAALAWIRPIGGLMWPIALIGWLLAELGRRSAPTAGNDPMGHRPWWHYCALALAAVTVVRLVAVPSSDQPNDVSRVEQLASALWIQTLHIRDPVFIETFMASPYFADFERSYARWLAARELPPDVTAVATFARYDMWKILTERRHGWTWFKIPTLVLTTVDGMTRAEATAWQGRVGIYLVAQHPLHFLDLTLGIGLPNIMTQPFRGYQSVEHAIAGLVDNADPGRIQALHHGAVACVEGGARQFATQRASEPARWIWIGIVLSALVVNLYRFRSPAPWTISAICLAHLLIAAVAAGALPRYRFPMDPFIVIVLLLAVGPLVVWARRAWSARQPGSADEI